MIWSSSEKPNHIIVVITIVIINIAILILSTEMLFFCTLYRGRQLLYIMVCAQMIWSSSEETSNIKSSSSSPLPPSSSSSSPQECSPPAVFLEACSYDRSLCGQLSNAEELFKWALQNTAMFQKYFWNIAAHSCAVFSFKTEICCKLQRHFWYMQNCSVL